MKTKIPAILLIFVIFTLGALAQPAGLESQPSLSSLLEELGEKSPPSQLPKIQLNSDIDTKELQKDAQTGDLDSQFKLGIAYSNGTLGLGTNFVKASQWFQKAANQGHARAQYNLAVILAEGWGMEPDQEMATVWLFKAARQGVADAQYHFGIALIEDPETQPQAIDFITKAAKQGFAEAELALAVFYSDGFGVPKDDSKARTWCEKAAGQKLAKAQMTLGTFYQEGQGGPQNKELGFKFFELSAKQGLAGGQHNLGDSFLNGEGTRLDKTKAMEWFRKAAIQGVPESQLALSKLYTGKYLEIMEGPILNEQGEIDALTAAYAWAVAASSKGEIEAVHAKRTILNAMKESMAPETFREATLKTKAILQRIKPPQPEQMKLLPF